MSPGFPSKRIFVYRLCSCVAHRPSKILLVQVGTLSSSHPSFGLCFLSFLRGDGCSSYLDRGGPLPFSANRGGEGRAATRAHWRAGSRALDRAASNTGKKGFLTCVSASARQSRAQCCARGCREFCCKILTKVIHTAVTSVVWTTRS